jgi:hypothetical protein
LWQEREVGLRHKEIGLGNGLEDRHHFDWYFGSRVQIANIAILRS